MSGLSRKSVDRILVRDEGMVNPTVELTQPGGPYDYGESLLTDGTGSWIIAPTLRPCYLTFSIPDVPLSDQCVGQHQGIYSDLAGVVMMAPTMIIGISVALEQSAKDDPLVVEVFERTDSDISVIAELPVRGRKSFRRDLSVTVNAGAELGVRLVATFGGVGELAFPGVIAVELEG